MTLLSPGALLWLLSIPVLLWFWRLASTQRHIRIPSLIPFEHLLKRPARRRTRLVVNVLFWLQLAALIGLTLALAQPMLFQHRTKTVLVILDTSASMGAHLRGSSPFERARQALRARIARKAPTDQYFVMTTSPAAPVTWQPTSDAAALTCALEALRVSHLGGNLSTAARIGRSLLGAEADETLVVTDEARPTDPLGDGVQWVTVGEPLPNVAIVGLDAQGPLCSPSDAHLIATIQNFSTDTVKVTVGATQRNRRLAEVGAELTPRVRRSVSLALPEGTEGVVEVGLAGQRDGLDIDNHAWVDLRRHATLPIVVRSQSPSFKRVMSRWLGACQALTWTADLPHDQGPYLLLTDREDDLGPSAAKAMVFLPPSSPTPVLSHWLVSADHPIGSYLPPVEVVSAALNLTAGVSSSGTPVVSGLLNGRKVPIVVIDERNGHEQVALLLDPAVGDESTPILLAFFNSLRWLMRYSNAATTGTPFTLSGLAPGVVKVVRPDGTTDTVATRGGEFSYEATTLAGRYQVEQGGSEATLWVNFFDPLESNLMDRASTWRPFQQHSAATASPPHRVAHPLANPLMLLILIVLLIEWWLASVKRS